MVGTTRCQVHTTATHALDDFSIIHIDFDHSIHRNAIRLECVSLSQGARKTVKQVATVAIVLLEALVDQSQDDFVGNQPASIHHFFRLNTHRSTGLDRCTQHVTGGNLWNAILFFNVIGLRALTGTGTT